VVARILLTNSSASAWATSALPFSTAVIASCRAFSAFVIATAFSCSAFFFCEIRASIVSSYLYTLSFEIFKIGSRLYHYPFG